MHEEGLKKYMIGDDNLNLRIEQPSATNSRHLELSVY